MRRRVKRLAINRACDGVFGAGIQGGIEHLEERRLLSVVFTDNYSSDTTANYTHTQQTPAPTFVDSWTVANGTLNYAVPTSDTNWNTSVFLTKPSTASTSGLLLSRTSGDLIAPNIYQAGLVLSGDPTNGGFVVAEYDNGIYNNHLVLLRETGGQLTGDEGGVGNPPVLADFGDISGFNNDTFHIAGTIDRTGVHPVITVAITDTTNTFNTFTTQTVTDTADPANYGGNAIGWRARFHDTVNGTNPVAFSVDNLELENLIPPATQAPNAPINLTATQATGSTNVNLSWTDPNSGTFQYNVERSTDGTNWSTIGSVAGVAQNGTANFTDQLLSPPGQTFLYRVKAINGFNGGSVSSPSNVASFTVGSRTGTSFTDDYSTDTTANYTEQFQTGLQDSYLVYSGNLNYSVLSNTGWNSSTFLLKPSLANTSGLYNFTTSGDIISPNDTQAGLVISGDDVNGGFVVQENAASHHFNLLRLTGAQMLGDEGGTANPPVLADLGDITNHEFDTYHISVNVDRTTAHPVFMVTITDLTDSTFTLAPKTVTDTNDPGYFGGVQIGWRMRVPDAVHFATLDNLSLNPGTLPSATHAPAAPTNLTGSESNGTVTLHVTNNADNATDLIVERSTNGVGFTPIGDITPGAPGSTGTFTETPIALAGTVFYYRVVAFNGFNGGTYSAPSNVAQVTISTSSGATATFYNQGFWGGAPVDRQGVTTIDWADPNGQALDPSKVTNNSENGVIYTGKLKISTPGMYTFVTNTSEDGYLYVDGVLVSSDPGDHVARDATNLVPLNLAAGNYDFVFMQTWARYVGFDGNEAAHFEWITPGNTTPTLVPALSMDPRSDTPTTPGTPTITTTGANAIDVSFTANNNAVMHYLLQRSGDGGTTWTTISQLDPASNGQTGGTPGTSVTVHAEDAAPIQGATYQYRAIAVGADGQSAPSGASASAVVPAYTVSSSAPGVEAHYSNSELWKTGTPSPVGSPDEFAVVTTPSTNNGGIDYGLGGNQSTDLTPYPDIPRIHPISYSAVFTGKILTDDAGVYTFTSNTDDDGYFYVAGQLVSSDPGGHGPEEPPAANIHPITLAAHTAYDFVFLFNQFAGGSAIHAEWVEPSNPNRVPVPISNGTTGGFLQASDTPHQISVDPTTGAITDTPSGSAAGNVTATASPAGIGLSWTDQAISEIWFEVQRATSASGPFTTIGMAGINASGYTDSTAVVGTHYYYRVRGINYDGVGPYSNTADAVAVGATQTIVGTAGNDTITIKVDPTDNTKDDVWLNVPTSGAFSEQVSNGQTIVITGGGVATGGTDTIVFDSSNGNPIPTGAAGTVMRLNSGTGTFTLGGTAPTLDASHVVDLGTSTLVIPYTGTSPLPLIQGYLKNGTIKSTDAAGSSGKFGIADVDANSKVTLSYRVIGDLNGDGTVAFADLLTMAQNYNKTGKDWSTGDLTYDGTVNFNDLLALAQHYNQSAAAAPAAAAATPLAAIAADDVLLGKKSRKR